MNLILCGMMGSGKTTVGQALQALLGWKLCDTDEHIVKIHGKISDIFERYGESYFRDLETQAVRELAQKDRLVISTGGGLVLRQENVELLHTCGKIVFLRAEIQTLLQRLQKDKDRPLLQNTELRARVEKLLIERTPIYERIADCIVDVDGKTPEVIAKEIVEKIKMRVVGTR